MGFRHGIDSKIYVGGYDLTSSLNDYTVGRLRELADKTTFNDTGRARIAGLIDGSVDVSGLFGGSTAETEYAFEAALASSADVVWSVLSQDDVAGRKGYQTASDQSSFSVTSPIEGLVSAAAAAAPAEGASRGLDYAVILQAAGAQSTDGNSSTVDHGSDTTGGGAAYAQLFSFSGTSLSFSVAHSTSGVFGGEEVSETFTIAASDAPKSQRLAISTNPIGRHARAEWTLNGSANIHVSLVRY